MSETFVEYRHVGVADALRQGDVLESTFTDASVWQRHLVVVTADCDFAHDKHQGRVTCVPLLAAEEYLAAAQIPKIRERLAKKQVALLRELLERVSGPAISDARMREWASEQDPETIITTLGLLGQDADDARVSIRALQLIDSPATGLKALVDALVDSQMLGPKPPKRGNALKLVLGPLQECFRRPPGDALFVSAFAAGHEDGYFAYLRHLEQLWQSEISEGATRREVKYRRISRLQDRLTLALVQRFALVFMSIGLPEEYEDLCDIHSEMLGESLT